MKKSIISGLFAFLLPVFFSALASADLVADRAVCNSEVAPYDQRLLACTRLIEDPEFAEKVWAYTQRAYVNLQLKKYPEALRDIQYVIEKSPQKEYWNYYFLGRVYTALNEVEKALEAFAMALELKPDYCPALSSRAALYRKAKRFADAVLDYSSCLRGTPFDASAYTNRGMCYEELKKTDLAIRDYKIASLLNENIGYAPARLEALVKHKPSPLLPMEFVTPAKNMKIRYLQVLLPRDMRDDFEKAMGDLVDWFKPKPKELPLAKAIATRTIVDSREDETMTKLDIEAKANVPSSIPESMLVYRLMLPVSAKMGAAGPELKIMMDREPLKNLWPLAVGKTGSGNGTFELLCPPMENEVTRKMGCKPNIFIKIGKLTYNILVEKSEQILVPAGLFNTYVVRYREIGEIELMGQKQKREVETKFWISPELSWWVRRTSQEGDKIMVIEAMDIAK